MKRLDLILNGKGGVGKSFFAVNFVQFLKDKGIAHIAIDSDNENSTLKRFHPDTRFLDLNNRRELDGIFSALEKASLVVMDCRAASTDLFIDYFTEIDLPAVLSALGATLTLVMPVNHESDSVDQIQRLADQFGKKCNYVVVRNAAHSESFALFESSGYSKLGVSTISQAIRAETFFNAKFKIVNEIVIWLHGLIDDLNFYEDDAERFEKAMALLGLAVGFETQRPEAELGKGPDDLWALGGLRFLVIECKNGATAATTIAKKDADQLAGSINWFKNAYDQSCQVTPVMVHPALVFHDAASPIADVRIIDGECLGKIRADLLGYANALGALNAMPKAEQLQGFFAQSNFTREKFVPNFTKVSKRR